MLDHAHAQFEDAYDRRAATNQPESEELSLH